MKKYVEMLLIVLICIPLGASIGAIDALFGRVLLRITDVRGEYVGVLLPFLGIVGVGIVFAYQTYGANSSKGMGLLFEVGQGKEEKIPLRLIPFVMIGTWLTHLFGGSAGREGVAVQIGGALSHSVGKHIPIKHASKIFLVAGMAAGFSGLFRTPLAATFFALEVMTIGILELEALLPSTVAAFTACTVSAVLGLEKFSVGLEEHITLQGEVAVKLVVVGVIFGVVGAGFARGLAFAKKTFAAYIEKPLLRIFVVGLIVSVALWLFGKGRYCGLGTNLIQYSFSGEKIYGYDWLLKLVFTIITLAAGFQGGEVTPLFSIGASLGVVLAGVLGLPVAFGAALGYVAVFGSATNTLLAPILIGGEVFGYEYLPYFCIVVICAYGINGDSSIYGAQKKR